MDLGGFVFHKCVTTSLYVEEQFLLHNLFSKMWINWRDNMEKVLREHEATP